MAKQEDITKLPILNIGVVGHIDHGKTTLLSALQVGMYNHVRGDGREFCVSVEESIKIQSEDGRSVESLDIRPFINNLPFSRSTERFSTTNASGSTSQAANIIEAIEMGVQVLMLDEVITNFVIYKHIHVHICTHVQTCNRNIITYTLTYISLTHAHTHRTRVPRTL